MPTYTGRMSATYFQRTQKEKGYVEERRERRIEGENRKRGRIKRRKGKGRERKENRMRQNKGNKHNVQL